MAFGSDVFDISMVIARMGLEGTIVGGFALHGQTGRIASTNLDASDSFWKFI